jgi:hypothetical protein
MYESLYEHLIDFNLYIFAFDDLTYDILENLKLDKVILISLKEFESSELLKVKNGRSKAEYCWTCTPSVISYVLENYAVSNCTYVDSDLFFYSDPSVLISELDKYNKNVLITEHRYSYFPGIYELKRAGRFCVQFMTFKKEDTSLKILNHWKQQCINWCFAKHEDGKFGDQKYLDVWPETYPNIHILQNLGGGIAPWNLQQYDFYIERNTLIGREKKIDSAFDVVFYHFQYVKLLKNGNYDIGWYMIPYRIKRLFYMPYLNKIQEIEDKLKNLNVDYHPGIAENQNDNIRNFLKSGIKKLFRYNILNPNINGVYFRS